MAIDRSPAFRFYPKDWRDVKVRRMSLAAQGAYLSILCDMWIDSKDQCSILDCNPFIAKSLGISEKMWLGIRCEIQHADEPLLTEKRGRLYSLRLHRETLKQRKYAEEQRERGVAGAKKRWGNDDSERHSERHSTRHSTRHSETVAQGEPKDGSSSSSSSSSSLSSSGGIKKEKKDKKEKIAGAVQDIAPAVNGIATWEAYQDSYLRRYGVRPVRNQTVNSQLKHVVDRLGQEEAPLVAAFYLTHNKPLYVSARHATNLLVRDCEGLRTEWATGVKATTSEAKNLEFKDNVVGQADRVLANIAKRGGVHG